MVKVGMDVQQFANLYKISVLCKCECHNFT